MSDSRAPGAAASHICPTQGKAGPFPPTRTRTVGSASNRRGAGERKHSPTCVSVVLPLHQTLRPAAAQAIDTTPVPLPSPHQLKPKSAERTHLGPEHEDERPEHPG